MQMCNHVRDTLDNLLRVQEQGINQNFSQRQKIFSVPFCSQAGIYGERQKHTQSHCV